MKHPLLTLFISCGLASAALAANDTCTRGSCGGPPDSKTCGKECGKECDKGKSKECDKQCDKDKGKEADKKAAPKPMRHAA